MNRAEFVDFFCEKRKCTRSTGTTSYYNIKRIRKMQKLSELIPRTNKWVTDSTIAVIKTLPDTPQKNLFATLVAYLKATGASNAKIDKFSDVMTDASEKVSLEYQKQELSATQQKKYIPMAKVRRFFAEVKRQAADIDLWNQKTWSTADRQLAQKVLMLALHGNTEPPPRLEFARLRYVSEPGQLPGNVLYRTKKAWRARITVGKTASVAKPFDIKFSKATARLLNKYAKKIQYGDFVFTSKNNEPLSPNTYGKKLQGYYRARFNKPVGAGMLRVIYLSEKHKDIPRLRELQNTADKMMHSVRTALGTYTKKS